MKFKNLNIVRVGLMSFLFIDFIALYLGEHNAFESFSFLSAPLKLVSFFVLLSLVIFKGRFSIRLMLIFSTLGVLGAGQLLLSVSLSLASYIFFIAKFLLLCLFDPKDVKYALLFFVKLIFITLPVVFLLYSGSETTRGGVDFGFNNENKLPFIMCSVLITIFMISDEHNKFRYYKALSLISVLIISIYAGSRTAPLTAILLFLFCFTFRAMPITKRLAVFVPIIAILCTILLSTKYSDNLEVNLALSSRPANWQKFIHEEEITILPSQLKISEYKKDLTDIEFRRLSGMGDSQAYFFDNAYINILYRTGIVITVFFLCIHLFFMLKISNPYLLASGAVISIQMVTESAIFYPIGTYMIWLVLSYLSYFKSKLIY